MWIHLIKDHGWIWFKGPPLQGGASGPWGVLLLPGDLQWRHPRPASTRRTQLATTASTCYWDPSLPSLRWCVQMEKQWTTYYLVPAKTKKHPGCPIQIIQSQSQKTTLEPVDRFGWYFAILQPFCLSPVEIITSCSPAQSCIQNSTKCLAKRSHPNWS